MVESKFKPRDFVEDVITGFKGVVITLQKYEFQEDRYHVQPVELKDGAVQEGFVFDENQLKLTNSSDSGIEWPESKLLPGMKVKDKNSDLEGTIMIVVHYHTGCNRVGIQSRELQKGVTADWCYIDEDAAIVQGEVKRPTEKKRTGGFKPRVPARP